jgi:hypothetical protein
VSAAQQHGSSIRASQELPLLDSILFFVSPKHTATARGCSGKRKSDGVSTKSCTSESTSLSQFAPEIQPYRFPCSNLANEIPPLLKLISSAMAIDLNPVHVMAFYKGVSQHSLGPASSISGDMSDRP